MIPKTWLNVGYITQTVKVGESVLIESQGGFSKKEAPCSGFVVTDQNGNSMFIPDSDENVRRLNRRLK